MYNETIDRIIKTLREQGEAYHKIAEILNKEFGVYKSPDAIRKRYYKLRETSNISSDDVPLDTTEDTSVITSSKVTVDEDTLTIGIISDTHMGSKYFAKEALLDFYQTMQHYGVTHVFHAGDVLDGDGWLFRGQLYEITTIGVNNILDEVVNTYPTYDGLTQHMISGQHDHIFYKRYGYNILQHLAHYRSDIMYHGDFLSYITLQYKNISVRIVLQHGSNSLTVAHSYRLQKYIDIAQTVLPQPFDILVLGHYHSMIILPDYKHTFGIMPGCFQYSTNLFTEKGLVPTIGGIILRIHFTDNGWHSEHIVRTYPVKPLYEFIRGG